MYYITQINGKYWLEFQGEMQLMTSPEYVIFDKDGYFSKMKRKHSW